MNQKITRHKSAADDLKQQSQLFPHHGQDLFSPGQKHQAAVPEAPQRGPLHPHSLPAQCHVFWYSSLGVFSL